MLNQALADHLRHKIWDNMTHDNVSYYAQSLSDTDYGTTHVAVLAPNGDAVSVTTTINRRWVWKLLLVINKSINQHLLLLNQRRMIVSFCLILMGAFKSYQIFIFTP